MEEERGGRRGKGRGAIGRGAIGRGAQHHTTSYIPATASLLRAVGEEGEAVASEEEAEASEEEALCLRPQEEEALFLRPALLLRRYSYGLPFSYGAILTACPSLTASGSSCYPLTASATGSPRAVLDAL